MQILTQAHDQLFRRCPDERFASLSDLWQHCQRQREQSTDLWPMPHELRAVPQEGRMDLSIGDDRVLQLNDWSFSQLCRQAGVNRDTVNRLSPETASQVFSETLAPGSKPLQIFANADHVRSIHGATYTRLHNTGLLAVVSEFATDFQPPQEALDGSTGLYCGEQDLFCFLIDPTGWTEIDGEAFAPGFFVWNSEVGKRSVGVQTFWFQAVCQNHLIWDAVDVVDWSRKHTRNVHESLTEIRRIIERLVTRRDERRDGFAEVIKRAMSTRLGDDTDDVLKVLHRRGIRRKLAKEAVEIAKEKGALSIFAVIDALTRLAGQQSNAGDRLDTDLKASALLDLATL